MRASLIVPLLVAILSWSALTARADNTSLDTSFATAGRFSESLNNLNLSTLAHLPRPGGGSVVVQAYSIANSSGPYKLYTYLYSASGAWVSSQSAGAFVEFSRLGGAAIDSQGRIVVVGSTRVSGGDYDFRVVRLHPGGLLVHRRDHVLHLSADKADVSNAEVRARFETLARKVLSRLP